MSRVECCGHLITDLLVEGAKRFARIHPQVGVAYILVYFLYCMCVLEVWLMLSRILVHVG